MDISQHVTRNRAALVALLVFGTAAASAFAQPGGGGGGGTGGGTIYYVGPWEGATQGGTAVMTTMNSDGSNKTRLGLGIFGPPSTALHANHRWFVDSKPIEGSFYPDGTQRSEVFAFRDDYYYALNNTPFTRVQLTDDPTLQPAVASSEWVPGDGRVSFKGRRWSSTEPGATIVEGGLYTVLLVFGVDGNIVGSGAPPAAPAVAFPLDGQLWPAFAQYGWAPGADKVVYASSGLWIADPATGTHTCISSGSAAHPRYSPDGTKIAYTTATLSIATIKPDGTGVKVVLPRTSAWSFYSPHWSPTGSHIACTGQANSGTPANLDVFRVSAKGTNPTNLTNTAAPLNEYVHFFGGGGWR